MKKNQYTNPDLSFAELLNEHECNPTLEKDSDCLRCLLGHLMNTNAECLINPRASLDELIVLIFRIRNIIQKSKFRPSPYLGTAKETEGDLWIQLATLLIYAAGELMDDCNAHNLVKFLGGATRTFGKIISTYYPQV